MTIRFVTLFDSDTHGLKTISNINILQSNDSNLYKKQKVLLKKNREKNTFKIMLTNNLLDHFSIGLLFFVFKEFGMCQILIG